jgi:hypothetical protein
MTANLGLVTHAAERHANELPAERRRNRFRQRRLPDSGRPDEAENRALHVGLQLADGQVLDDAVLGALEAGMIGVEHRLGLQQIDVLVGPLRPRERDEPVDVGPGDRVLGGGRGHFRQSIELAKRFLLHLVGHPRRFDLVAQLVDFLGLIVAFAELLLDRLHLLAQEVLALVLADFGLHLGLNLRSQLENLELLGEDPVELIHPRAQVDGLEQLLFHRRPDRAETGRDEVGQPARIGDVRRKHRQIVREDGRELNDLLEVRPDVPLERVDLERVPRRLDIGHFLDLRPQVRLGGRDARKPDACEALDNQPQAAVGQLEHFVDVSERADGVQVGLSRLFQAGIALREDADQLAPGDGLVDELDGTLAGHGQRHERVREEHGVAQRQHRHVRGDRERALAAARLGASGLIAHKTSSVLAGPFPPAPASTRSKPVIAATTAARGCLASPSPRAWEPCLSI